MANEPERNGLTYFRNSTVVYTLVYTIYTTIYYIYNINILVYALIHLAGRAPSRELNFVNISRHVTSHRYIYHVSHQAIADRITTAIPRAAISCPPTIAD